MKNFKNLFFICVFLGIILSSKTILAKPLERHSKLWSSINNTGHFKNKKLKYILQLHGRFDDGDDMLEQTIMRAGLGYQIAKTISLWMGYDFIPFSNRSTGKIEFENRPWQQLLWRTLNNEKVTISLRTRLEQRIRSNNDDIALRLRQKITFKLPNAIANTLTPVLYEEMFFNLNHPEWVNKNVVDQNRILCGIDIPINRNNILQIGYLNQFEFRSPKNRMSHILSLSLIIRT